MPVYAYHRLTDLEWAVVRQLQGLLRTVFSIFIAGVCLYIGLTLCPQAKGQSLMPPSLFTPPMTGL